MLDSAKVNARRRIGPMIILLSSAVDEGRPGDRSDLDRHFAILRTDMDKVRAYFETFIAPNLNEVGE